LIHVFILLIDFADSDHNPTECGAEIAHPHRGQGDGFSHRGSRERERYPIAIAEAAYREKNSDD
jgi:hypothetical protein